MKLAENQDEEKGENEDNILNQFKGDTDQD